MPVPRILRGATNKAVTVGSSSTEILAFNDQRGYATIINDSNEDVYLALEEAAVMNSGARLAANGGTYEIGGGGDNYFGSVYGICTSGSKVVVVTEINSI